MVSYVTVIVPCIQEEWYWHS
jgi:hypothetical protein